jgi:membrane dipeptidase
MVDHMDALLQRLGPTRVALGSDFDGATMPAAIRDAAGLPVLLEAMRARGYSGEIIEKIAWRNWVRVLKQTWGE